MQSLENFKDTDKPRSYKRYFKGVEETDAVLDALTTKKQLERFWPLKKFDPKNGLEIEKCNETLWSKTIRNNSQLNVIMGYLHKGLQMKDDYETLERCVSMYTHWLEILTKKGFTAPVTYARSMPMSMLPPFFYNNVQTLVPRIFKHLGLLFNIKPTDSSVYKIQHHRPLFELVFDTIAKLGDIPIDNEDAETHVNPSQHKRPKWIWDHILKFLLYIVDIWCCGDIDVVPDVCERAIKLMLNSFIVASHESFPGPQLWQEFEMLCQSILHIIPLCKKWKDVCMILTTQQLDTMYGPHKGHNLRTTGDFHRTQRLSIIIAQMHEENLLQCWFRFIPLLGNPANLMIPTTTWAPNLRSNKTLQKNYSVKTAQPKLPKVCELITQGIRCMVDLFLNVGLPRNVALGDYESRAESPEKMSYSQTDLSQHGGDTSNICTQSAPANIISRAFQQQAQHQKINSKDYPFDCKILPTGNSVLAVFGEWLFDITQTNVVDQKNKFYRARAEALGTLCFVFSHNKYHDPFHQEHLTRFVMRLSDGLRTGIATLNTEEKEEEDQGLILNKILQECGSLLKVDLPGINVLLPSFFTMVDKFLSGPVTQENIQLRRHAIEILLSIICLPLHYPDMPLQMQEVKDGKDHPGARGVMKDYLKKIIDLLLTALRIESYEDNKSQIISGLYILLLDITHSRSTNTSPGIDEYAQNMFTASVPISPTSPRSTEDYERFYSGSNEFLHRVEDDTCTLLWKETIKGICDILAKASDPEHEIKFWYVPFAILCGLSALFPYTKSIETSYKTVILRLCDYITKVCSRPSPKQSQDLHSMLNAAYNALGVWCLYYTDLFKDRDTLLSCLKVVELGMSGKSSYLDDRKEYIIKENKRNQEFSQRVGAKAEFLLKQLTHQSFHTNSLFSERSLIEDWAEKYPGKFPKLRYLVFEQKVIMCFIDPPIHSDTPELYEVIRDPSMGLSVHWHKYDKKPFSDTASNEAREKVERPKPRRPSVDFEFDDGDVQIQPSWPPSFPKNYNTCSVDSEEPKIEDVMQEINSQPQFNNPLCPLKFEDLGTCDKDDLTDPLGRINLDNKDVPEDLQPPECVKEFEASRLFMSHVGLLTPQMFEGKKPQLVLLEGSERLQARLKQLDELPTRDCHTVVVVYMRSGQSNLEEMLGNTKTLQAGGKSYQQFLGALGEWVDIGKHKGWSGLNHLQKWCEAPVSPVFPYYSDPNHEMIFILPNLIPREKGDKGDKTEGDRDSPDSNIGITLYEKESEQAEYSAPPSLNNLTQQNLLKNILWESPAGDDAIISTPPSKIVIVWAESFDDTERFPVRHLPKSLGCEEGTRFVLLFIHPLESGLFKTNVQAPWKCHAAGPLDEHKKVVSERILAAVVRETCLNIRVSVLLEQDPKLRPHSRRKRAIERIMNDHKAQDSSFYSCFFNLTKPESNFPRGS